MTGTSEDAVVVVVPRVRRVERGGVRGLERKDSSMSMSMQVERRRGGGRNNTKDGPL